MKWSWELRPAAERELKKLDRKVVASVLDGLDLLAQEMNEHGRPVQADTKELKGLDAEFRLRLGDYRVRYGIEFREVKAEGGDAVTEGAIVVYHVANRREAY